jgi:hypothetical protein
VETSKQYQKKYLVCDKEPVFIEILADDKHLCTMYVTQAICCPICSFVIQMHAVEEIVQQRTPISELKNRTGRSANESWKSQYHKALQNGVYAR